MVFILPLIFNEMIVSVSGCQDPYLLTDTLQSHSLKCLSVDKVIRILTATYRHNYLIENT